MGSLNDILSKIIHGNMDFCCLCLVNIEDGNKNFIDSQITINDSIVNIEDMLDLVLGAVASTVSISEGLCDQCLDVTVQSFRLITMCQKNHENLSRAIDDLTHSSENVVTNLEEFSSVFINLDTEDTMPKHYYNNIVAVETTHDAAQVLTMVKSQTKLKQEIEQNNLYVTHNKNNGRAVSEWKNKLPFKYFDIPASKFANNFYCILCSKTFKVEKDLHKHFLEVHFYTEFKCNICSKEFLSQNMLDDHEENDHRLFCCVCGEQFSSTAGLRRHEVKHGVSTKRAIICTDCGRTYGSKTAYKTHLVDKVCGQTRRKSSKDGTYVCDHCSKTFCNKPYLAKHIHHEHGDARGYVCKWCNKKFYTPSRLDTHIVKHTLEKRFTCKICSGKFGTKMALVYHTRLHTGIKPYACNYCEESFLSSSRRIDHERRRHMPPSLKCDTCGAMFKTTGSLLKHKKRHLSGSASFRRIIPPPIANEVQINS